MKHASLSLSSFPRMREPSRRTVFNWVPAFAGMTGIVLAGCSPSVPDIANSEVLPTLKLEKPTVGSIQCYTENDGIKAPTMAFKFDEENHTVIDLMDEAFNYDVKFNAANIILTFKRENIMDLDICKFHFNRISGDGALYCMLAETDNYQQELEFKCQPFGKRKF